MTKRLPPLQSLLAFEAAARLGGITRAAEELSLTQSAITHQIQNLEEWVGQPLFNRVGRGVKLSAAGELFSKTVDATLSTLLDGRKRIEPYRNQDSVLLACPADFAAGWVLPRLPALRALHPTLDVWLITRDELRDIDRIDVDLIISTQDLSNDNMVSTAWLADEAIAVCSPALAQQLDGLAPELAVLQAPLIIDEYASQWAPWLGDLELRAQRSVTLEDTLLRVQAAAQGLGLAMVPRSVADQALDSQRVCHLPQFPSLPLPTRWLSKSRLAPRTPSADVVFDWLCRQSPQNASLGVQP
ncbi:LysR substrate-binding domain-containing protein [Curvibacter sp. APW13]|uniref:LysR substrate-binding domain-containing protein n=1 Tax=Curvibacter sp. APW13 TaxID=3077236 RepID=UPI0028DF29AE|nr:LysR substrate-binding domain-containing protein [Curvibacter sp. APW13]MDT8992326.1 LysR substrate-binding domain-containing protein [Curvibacter sp. APW13]